MEGAYKKIGGTSFHVDAIKKMSFKGFKETYKDILKGQDLDKTYEDLTGKKAKKSDDDILG